MEVFLLSGRDKAWTEKQQSPLSTLFLAWDKVLSHFQAATNTQLPSGLHFLRIQVASFLLYHSLCIAKAWHQPQVRNGNGPKLGLTCYPFLTPLKRINWARVEELEVSSLFSNFLLHSPLLLWAMATTLFTRADSAVLPSQYWKHRNIYIAQDGYKI